MKTNEHDYYSELENNFEKHLIYGEILTKLGLALDLSYKKINFCDDSIKLDFTSNFENSQNIPFEVEEVQFFITT